MVAELDPVEVLPVSAVSPVVALLFVLFVVNSDSICCRS
jgi:hypothetical protein